MTDHEIKISAVRARGGLLGRPVLAVLIASLVLSGIAWLALSYVQN